MLRVSSVPLPSSLSFASYGSDRLLRKSSLSQPEPPKGLICRRVGWLRAFCLVRWAGDDGWWKATAPNGRRRRVVTTRHMPDDGLFERIVCCFSISGRMQIFDSREGKAPRIWNGFLAARH